MCYLTGLRCVTYLITAQEIETLEDGDGQEESMVGCGCFAQVLLSVAILTSYFLRPPLLPGPHQHQREAAQVRAGVRGEGHRHRQGIT